MLKQQYMEYLNLSGLFTDNELRATFKNMMSETRNSNIFKEEKIEKASKYNEALNYLRQYTKKESIDSNNIYSDKKCNVFGMNYYELDKLLQKSDNYNSEEIIEKITEKFNEKFMNKKYILQLTIISDDLWSFPIDRLIGMYLLDNTNNVSFASYIITLTNICNSFNKLCSDFSLEEEYVNFINSCEKSFLVYLSQQVEIKYICLALNEKEYELRHRFEYENSNFKGSFLEYLESLFDIKSMTDSLSVSIDELNECYNEYIKLGRNESIYVFIKDFYEIKDYCNNLLHVYLSLKKRYIKIPVGERLKSFKNWVQLHKAEGTTGLTSEQILEQLYIGAKENGFGGQIDDYITSLVSSKTKKLSLR